MKKSVNQKRYFVLLSRLVILTFILGSFLARPADVTAVPELDEGDWQRVDFITLGEDREDRVFESMEISNENAEEMGPFFVAYVGWPLVIGYNFLAGTSVNLTIDDPGVPGVEVDENSMSNTSGKVNFYPGIELLPGFIVEMTDGTTTKTHIVKNLSVTDINQSTDTLSGTADPGVVSVYVWEYGNDVFELRTPTADASGNWTADFSGSIDIAPGSDGIVQQADEDSDQTFYSWNIALPTISVDPDTDGIGGSDWSPGDTITLTIDDPANGLGVDYTTADSTDSGGWVLFDLTGIYDVKAGQTITQTDGITTKTHVVRNIAKTTHSYLFDTISGLADPGSEVRVVTWVGGTSPLRGYVEYVVADASGKWKADYSERMEIDTSPGGYISQKDEDEDTTDRSFTLGPPENDDIEEPETLPEGPSDNFFVTDGSTHSGDEPSFAACGGTGLATVWYKFEPVNSGSMSLDTMGTTYNTMLGVWSGAPGSLALVKCNNDALGTPQSQVSFNYSAGMTYYIGVAQKGTSETGGEMKLHATSFQDVPGNHPLWKFVEGFFAKGITTGCAVNPMRYCPDQVVTRGQMAVFLLRSIHADDPELYVPEDVEPDTFADSPAAAFMEPWIEQFYATKITTGCAAAPLRYCPERNVTRGEMAVLVLRALHKDELPYTPTPSPSVVGIFADVPASNWMKPWIEEFYELGITTGCGVSGDKLLYCPTRNVNRAEMATFVDRAFKFPALP